MRRSRHLFRIFQRQDRVRKRSVSRLSHCGQKDLHLFSFSRILGKKPDQFFPSFHFCFIKNRSSQHLVKDIFSRRGHCLIDQHINPVHIQIIPRNIVDKKNFACLPAEIMGNCFNISGRILSFRDITVRPPYFPADYLTSFSVFIQDPEKKKQYDPRRKENRFHIWIHNTASL